MYCRAARVFPCSACVTCGLHTMYVCCCTTLRCSCTACAASGQLSVQVQGESAWLQAPLFAALPQLFRAAKCTRRKSTPDMQCSCVQVWHMVPMLLFNEVQLCVSCLLCCVLQSAASRVQWSHIACVEHWVCASVHWLDGYMHSCTSCMAVWVVDWACPMHSYACANAVHSCNQLNPGAAAGLSSGLHLSKAGHPRALTLGCEVLTRRSPS
jgi:hypothetical protein